MNEEGSAADFVTDLTDIKPIPNSQFPIPNLKSKI
jgi:hypothetical protein